MSKSFDDWRKFDDEKFVEELEFRSGLSGHLSSSTYNPKGSDSLRRKLEALESKNQVDLLKRAGRASHRKNRQKVQERQSNGNELTDERSCCSDDIETVMFRFVDALGNTFLEVERLRSLTEKKRLHLDGFTKSLKLLDDISQMLETVQLISAGETCDSDTIAEIHGALRSLLLQVFSCCSLFAVSIGHFSIAVDVSRSIIKSKGADSLAGFWIIRALAFAGLGNPYLSYLHLKSAYSIDESYPGLRQTIDEMEVGLVSLCRSSNFQLVDIEVEVSRVVYFVTQNENLPILRENSDISFLHAQDFRFLVDPSKYFDGIFQCILSSLKQNGMLALLKSMHSRHFPRQPNSMWCEFGFFVAHRLFLDGQFLFLENMFSSAESKYFASVVVLCDLIEEMGTHTTLWQKAKGILSIGLLNLAVCRMKRKTAREERKYTTYESSERLLRVATLLDRVTLISRASILQILHWSCDIGNSPLSSWKTVEVLIDSGRFEEALLELDRLHDQVLNSEDTADAVDTLCCEDYSRLFFCQVSLFGKYARNFVITKDCDGNLENFVSHCGVNTFSSQLPQQRIPRRFISEDPAAITENSIRNVTFPRMLSKTNSSLWSDSVEMKISSVHYLSSKFGLI